MSSKLPDARLERAERVLGTIETSRIVAAAAMIDANTSWTRRG
jgi:hypothetical protein